MHYAEDTIFIEWDEKVYLVPFAQPIWQLAKSELLYYELVLLTSGQSLPPATCPAFYHRYLDPSRTTISDLNRNVNVTGKLVVASLQAPGKEHPSGHLDYMHTDAETWLPTIGIDLPTQSQ